MEFIDAPGHAPHELCIYESRNNGLFAGDAVGIYLDGSEILLLATVPPNFDLELSIDTIKRLMKLKATMIYFAHFGASDKVQESMERVMNELRTWGDIADRAAMENVADNAVERIVARAHAELEPIREDMKALYDYLANVAMPICANGYMKYYLEKHQAK